MNTLTEAVARIKRQFTSANSVPVERASIRSEDISLVLDALPANESDKSPYITQHMAVGSDEFIEDLKKHHNEICLWGGTHMTRLIGYYEDNDDCYYVAAGKYGDKASLLSCVGGLLSLKEYLPDQVYQSIENTFSLNGSEPKESFEIKMDTKSA